MKTTKHRCLACGDSDAFFLIDVDKIVLLECVKCLDRRDIRDVHEYLSEGDRKDE